MLKYQCLCLFGFFLVLQGSSDLNNINLVVKKIPSFPFPIGKTFDIIIGPKEKDGLLTNSVTDTLVIQIRKPVGTGRQVAVIDFGFKFKIDNEINGEFIKVLSWSVSEDNKLSVALAFSSLAHNKVFEIYHLNVFSTAERRIKLKNLKLATNIYRSNITLYAPPMIEIMVNSAVDGPFAFAMGSTVDAVCRANGTSYANPRFHKIRNMKAIKNSRTEKEAKLQFVATKAIHQKNLTCQVGNENKSVNIQVFHGPTKVTFKPEVTDVVRNGTGITCVAADGFPTPRITWHFIEGPQNASQFYTISHYNQRLFLSGKAPIGSRWKFNCSSINDVLGTEQVHYKDLSFTVVDQMRNNSKENATSKCECKHWNMSADGDNYLIHEMKRTISNHSQNIKRLDLKIQNEMSKWKTNASRLWLELFKMKQNLELFKEQVKEQNMEKGKLRINLDKESKPGSDKVVSATTTAESTRKASTAVYKPVEKIQLKVDNFQSIRREGESIYSSELEIQKLGYKVRFLLRTSDRPVVVVALYLYPIRNKPVPSKVENVATITIYNSENLTFYRTIKLKIKAANDKKIYRPFYFYYDELLEAKVLQSDKIIIEFAVGIQSGRRNVDEGSKPGTDKVVSTTAESLRKAGTAVRKHLGYIQWKVDDFKGIRTEGESIDSSRLQIKRLGYDLQFFLRTRELSIVEVQLSMYAMKNKLFEGVVAMTIYNAENLRFYKTVKLKFKMGSNQWIDRSFYFYYDELDEAKVLQSDKVIIECSLAIT